MALTLPLFIVFEGIDGSGKTTLAGNIFTYFSALVPAILLAEPTGGGRGTEIRKLLKVGTTNNNGKLLELFILDRADDVRLNIAPALAAGKMVIMDRYYHSNAAYQGTDERPPADIISMNRARGFPAPDRVYLVDISPEEALRRIKSRNSAVDFYEDPRHLTRIRENYLSMADETFLVLDGTLAPRDLTGAVIADLKKNYTLR